MTADRGEEGFDGTVALVTGAGTGIGRAVALGLAARGAETVLVARTTSSLEEVAAEIRAGGGTARVVAGDLCSEDFVRELFDALRRDPGRLDLLVNNAGVAPFGPVESLEPDRLRQALELNVTAAYHCMQQAIRLMEERGGVGKIVNVGSVRSHWTEGGDSGAYNATKQALRAITESVARQLHGTGSRIAVGIVCPGVVDTPLTNPGGEPRPGWMKPDDVARSILHMAAAPPGVNVFDLTLFSTEQSPW